MFEKIFFNIFQNKIGSMQFVITLVTKPQQSIFFALFIFDFYHQAYRTGRSYRRMWCFGRNQKNITSLELHNLFFSIYLYSNLYIAFELVKKFVCFVVIIILAVVWSTDNHHNKIIRFLFLNFFISDRRLQ